MNSVCTLRVPSYNEKIKNHQNERGDGMSKRTGGYKSEGKYMQNPIPTSLYASLNMQNVHFLNAIPYTEYNVFFLFVSSCFCTILASILVCLTFSVKSKCEVTSSIQS